MFVSPNGEKVCWEVVAKNPDICVLVRILPSRLRITRAIFLRTNKLRHLVLTYQYCGLRFSTRYIFKFSLKFKSVNINTFTPSFFTTSINFLR